MMLVLAHARCCRVVETHRILHLVMRRRLLLVQLPRSTAGCQHLTSSGGTLRRVACHGRCVTTESEREAESFAHYSSEATTEGNVDDEVGRRVDNHQQLTDETKDPETLTVLAVVETVADVSFEEC